MLKKGQAIQGLQALLASLGLLHDAKLSRFIYALSQSYLLQLPHRSMLF